MCKPQEYLGVPESTRSTSKYLEVPGFKKQAAVEKPMDYELRPLNRSQGGEKVVEATTSGGNFVNGKSGRRRIINASSATSLGKVLLCESESKILWGKCFFAKVKVKLSKWSILLLKFGKEVFDTKYQEVHRLVAHSLLHRNNNSQRLRSFCQR